MQMSHADKHTYPQFTYYVKKDIPKLLSNAHVLHSLARIGGINRTTIGNALRWGSGPMIKITPLVGAYGEFTPNVHSNEIRINQSTVRDFEAGRGRCTARAGGVYLVGVALLHELVHWADDQDGVDRPGEEGAEFERAIYGGVIPSASSVCR